MRGLAQLGQRRPFVNLVKQSRHREGIVGAYLIELWRVYREDASMNMPFDGAKIALFVGDRLAVILRDDNPDILFPNHWDMPGGGREGDETPLGCVLRETWEELGVQIDPNCVFWGKRFGHPLGDKWFFVAHVPVDVAKDIRLGDEGQMWQLMMLAAYFDLPNHIERFADRLRLYLSGMEGDPFERPPAYKAGEVDGP